MLELDDKISDMADVSHLAAERAPGRRLAARRSSRGTGGDKRPADRGRKIWLVVWPKVAAIAIALGIWQLVVLSGWRPEYVLPAPATVFERLGELIADGTVFEALKVTGERALYGYAAALVIGVVLGSLVASSKIIRSAVGSHDHRAADDAVDRLVPARHPALPAVRTGHHVRGRARCRTVDRQRSDHRRRPCTADAPARRPDDGRHAAGSGSAT